MADYTKPSKNEKENASVSQEREKKKKVISNKAVIKRENGFSKLANVFLAEDVSSIKDVLIWEIVIPAIRDTLFKMIGNGAHMLLYGTPQANKKEARKPTVSYASYYERDEPLKSKETSLQITRAGVPRSIILYEKQDADDLMAEIYGTIEDYGRMNIRELKELIGDEKHIRYTDDGYGWNSSEKFYYEERITADGAEYRFHFPRPMPFD